MRNFVGGTENKSHIKWVTALDPDGKAHKLNQDNASDWKSRGPGYRVTGPWEEPKAAAPAPVDPEEDDDETEETETPDADATPTAADEALKELVALRVEAEALGVKVNDQWGKRRLRAEIDGAKLRAKA